MSIPIDQLTPENLQQFHREIRSIVQTGLPIDLGFPSDRSLLAGRLDEIANHLTQNLNRRESLHSLFNNESLVPVPYRNALVRWLETGGAWSIFDDAINVGDVQIAAKKTLGAVGLRLMILFTLTLLAFAGIAYFTLPKMMAIYDQLQIEPGKVISSLMNIRTWFPIWMPLAVLMVGYCVIRYRRLSFPRLARWLPLGGLFKSFIQASDAQRLASDVEEDPLRKVVSPMQQTNGTSPRENNTPLLRWAMSQDVGKQKEALSVISRYYQEVGKERFAAWNLLSPRFLFAFAGGVLVFALSLCVILPFVELLQELMREGGAARV